MPNIRTFASRSPMFCIFRNRAPAIDAGYAVEGLWPLAQLGVGMVPPGGSHLTWRYANPYHNGTLPKSWPSVQQQHKKGVETSAVRSFSPRLFLCAILLNIERSKREFQF